MCTSMDAVKSLICIYYFALSYNKFVLHGSFLSLYCLTLSLLWQAKLPWQVIPRSKFRAFKNIWNNPKSDVLLSHNIFCECEFKCTKIKHKGWTYTAQPYCNTFTTKIWQTEGVKQLWNQLGVCMGVLGGGGHYNNETLIVTHISEP